MFVKLFRTNNQFILVLLFVYGFLLWLKAFVNPNNIPEPHFVEFAYSYAFNYIKIYPFVSVATAFVLLFIQAVVLNNVVVKYTLIEKNTFLPAFVYVTLMSVLPENTTLNPLILFNFFLIYGLNLVNKIYDIEKPVKESFNLSFLISIAALIYINGIYFLVFVWLCYLVFRINLLRAWIASAIGFIVPFIFVAFYFFMLNDYTPFYMLINYYLQVKISLITPDYKFYGLLFILSLCIIAAFKYKMLDNERIIVLRKYASILIWLFIVSIIASFLSTDWTSHIAIAFVPASIFISQFLMRLKRQWIGELIIFIVLFVLFINHYII